MSTTYQPGTPPDDPKLLPQFLRQEFARLKQAMEGDQDLLELQVLHAAPAKTRAGMVVYADGTDWNPGSGEGVYRRDKANAAWVHLG